MLTNLTQLKSVIQGIEGCFHCNMNAPTHVVKEMLFQFLKYVGQIEDAAKAQEDAAKEKEASIIVPDPEEKQPE